MKKEIVSLLFTSFLLQAQAEKLSPQVARISLDMENVSVEKVLNEIEAMSDYHFLYNSKLINVDRKVSVSCSNNSIESVLYTLFNGTDVTYRVSENQIILSHKSLNNNKITPPRHLSSKIRLS